MILQAVHLTKHASSLQGLSGPRLTALCLKESLLPWMIDLDRFLDVVLLTQPLRAHLQTRHRDRTQDRQRTDRLQQRRENDRRPERVPDSCRLTPTRHC